MLRRRMGLGVIVAVVATMLASGPALAAVRPVGAVTSADMVGITTATACGVRMSATFTNIRGSDSVEFRLHSRTYDTTFRVFESLAARQTSVSSTVTVCAAGDTWDRLDVWLHTAGGKVVSTRTVVKTIVCAPR